MGVMKKRRYEPPTARDLSGAAASGQRVPPQPQSTCGNGSHPGGGSCLTGFLPFTTSVCNPTGSSPYISGCRTGTIATPVQCLSGSAPSPS
jgi:hypothetical protein